MNPWIQGLVALCVIVVTALLVPTIMAWRRTAERGERVLAIVEQDLRSLVGEIHELAGEIRALTRDAQAEVARAGAVIDRANDIGETLGRIVTAVSGLTRAGQLMGVAAGLKTGIDVFLHRLRRQGDNHES